MKKVLPGALAMAFAAALISCSHVPSRRSTASADKIETRRASQADKPRIERGQVTNLLQELADADSNGFVSEREALAAEEALDPFNSVPGTIEKLFDFAGKGFMGIGDMAQAKLAALLPAQKLMSSIPGPYPVATKADGLLDGDGDGTVTEDELSTVAAALFPDPSAEVPPKILEAFDSNADGALDEQEAMSAREFFRPHPVDPSRAIEAEFYPDAVGFISPETIGIGAGITAKGRVSTLDERVERLRVLARIKTDVPAAQASTVPAAAPVEKVSHLDLTRRKLAVVGVTSATRNVSPESLDGTATFLENAFVNLGSASLVDRGSIDKIARELELQSSAAFTDSPTAVKVGKLSGAEMIAVGTISLVGKRYYLNVKLIAVDTAEILASSIASAESEEGFLDMCQEAVVKLF